MAQLSARYAAALFDLAAESGNPDEYRAQSVFLRDTLQTDECRGLLEHPAITSAEKHSFIQNTLAGKINDDLLGFLHLLIAKNRVKFLFPALNLFIEKIRRNNRIITAEVVTAQPLDERQVSAIQALLAKKLDKQVDIQTKTDPSLIGGLYIYVDGYLLDYTVKKQLRDMTNALNDVAKG